MIDHFNANDPATADDLLNLSLAIVNNNNNAEKVDASAILKWADEERVLDRTTRRHHFANSAATFDQADPSTNANDASSPNAAPQADARGKHHEEKRLALLGWAIQELARCVDDASIPQLTRSGNLNCEALTSHLDGLRDACGFPPETARGFSRQNLLATIREAVSAAKTAKEQIESSDKN
ncbi:hypothetical protein [Denitromonas ohlonensis]|uniref:Uncharacterized protein n=2 Tax=Denitromonas TaxID=139331 RepID=A0A557R5Z5_9RHOO|nr:hypothetical protein [Denitromonas ohlonensis]TVO60558.1 hypothetical protein FHP90_17880 [Denitromonas ohlonensis]TVO72288.1 hypothetical protein FHP89_18580 [Denitromonas ohlonensis]